MPILNPSSLQAYDQVIDQRFNSRLESEATNPFFGRITMEIPTTANVVDVAWLTAFAAMREWIGQREVMDTLVDNYLIRDREYEATMKTKVREIEDGQYAMTGPLKAAELASAYARRRIDTILDLFVSGAGTPATIEDPEAEWFQAGNKVLSLDGKPYFATDHPMGRLVRKRVNGNETYVFDQTGEYSNLVTTPFSKEALKEVRTSFRKQRDHYGRPARNMPNLLVVGPDLEDAAREAVQPTLITRIDGDTETTATNTIANAFEVLVLSELGDSKAWALFDTTKDMKPFILTNRQAPIMQRTGNLTAAGAAGLVDATIFNEGAIFHGIRARWGAGYGLPHLGYLSTGTGA